MLRKKITTWENKEKCVLTGACQTNQPNLPLLKQPRDGRFFMRERLQRVNSNTLSLFVAFLFYFTAAVIIEGISSLIIVGHAMAKKNLPSCAVECQFAIFPQHITRLSYTIDLIPLDRFDYQGVFYMYVRNKKIIKMELALIMLPLVHTILTFLILQPCYCSAAVKNLLF